MANTITVTETATTIEIHMAQVDSYFLKRLRPVARWNAEKKSWIIDREDGRYDVENHPMALYIHQHFANVIKVPFLPSSVETPAEDQAPVEFVEEAPKMTLYDAIDASPVHTAEAIIVGRKETVHVRVLDDDATGQAEVRERSRAFAISEKKAWEYGWYRDLSDRPDGAAALIHERYQPAGDVRKLVIWSPVVAE